MAPSQDRLARGFSLSGFASNLSKSARWAQSPLTGSSTAFRQGRPSDEPQFTLSVRWVQAMSAPPYMKLYIADYHADTTHLSRDEHGAYLLLIMAMWRAGGKLPNTPHKLAKIAKCTADEWPLMWEALRDFFQIRGGIIRQARLSKEIEKYDAVVLRSQAGGKASAAKKRNENNVLDITKRARKFNQPEPEPYTEVSKEPSVTGKPKQPSKCVIPSDWEPDEENTAYALQHGLTIEETTRAALEFRDYFLDKQDRRPGWDRSWQRWVRTASDRKRERSQRLAARPAFGGGGGQGASSFAEVAARRRGFLQD